MMQASEDTPKLERIARMESNLDEVTALTAKLQEQLDAMKAAKKHAQALFQYYGSEVWRADRDLTLPLGSKAGVLSEDSVYDAITDLRNAAFDMLELGTDIFSRRGFDGHDQVKD